MDASSATRRPAGPDSDSGMQGSQPTRRLLLTSRLDAAGVSTQRSLSHSRSGWILWGSTTCTSSAGQSLTGYTSKLTMARYGGLAPLRGPRGPVGAAESTRHSQISLSAWHYELVQLRRASYADTRGSAGPDSRRLGQTTASRGCVLGHQAPRLGRRDAGERADSTLAADVSTPRSFSHRGPAGQAGSIGVTCTSSS